MRVRVTTDGCGFCGFCGSFSQTVDIAYFSRFLACGSRVVLACGFVVMWFLCGFWIARSALRVRNGKSCQNPRIGASIQVKCVPRARSALRARWLELRPRHAQKPQKAHNVVFAIFVVFAELVVFVGFVVFCRACGFCRLCGFLPSLWFLSALWFFAELVVFGRACGSPFQSRDKGQTAKEFDATVEVVLVT